MTAVSVLTDGLHFAGEMAWETWWALVLGFTLAGIIETFVDEDTMVTALGGDGVRELGLGTIFGALSSSCSFGAVATAKTLFKKGASPVASLAAFQFASTNLVIEMGLVMWILLGWEFVGANVVAGLILIVILALLFKYLVPTAWVRSARDHVQTVDGVRDPVCGMEVNPTSDDVVTLDTPSGTQYFCSTSCKQRYETAEATAATGLEQIRSRHGWQRVAQNAIGEWQMLWTDIVAGFLIAGLLGAAVPATWWAALFESGGAGSFTWIATSAILGVIIGVVTFVCSVGNVPFAVVLWNSGIAFGGLMAFIFADLIIPPLMNAYRRYYGVRFAATLVTGIAVAAVLAGIAIHYLWTGIGLVPPPGTVGGTAPTGYTTILNTLFTLVFLGEVALVWQTRTTDRDDDDGHAHAEPSE